MDFRALNLMERTQLIRALRGNAEQDRAILMDRRDTSFLGSAGRADDLETANVIDAVRDIPSHY